MKHLLLFVAFAGILLFANSSIAQDEVVHPTKVSTAIYFD